MTTPAFRGVSACDALETRCAADLLVYFHRHPNVFVTTDWLPSRIGYVAQDVDAAIESLTSAGVITQRRHAERDVVMYRLTATPWSPGSAQIESINRWRRQIWLLLEAYERCERAAVHAARARQRVERTEALLATIRTKSRLTRDG